MNDNQLDPGAIEPRSGLVVGFDESAIEMKRSLAGQRTEATRQIARVQAEVEDTKAELECKRREMELEFDRQRDELEAKMAPLKQQLKQLEEMAWTVDLYLGRDERLTVLRDGKPASIDEPIVLRQMVLAMDEESLVLVEQGGIDATRKQAFVDWLIESDEHLDQVIPDRKGVVVLVPTKQQRDYGDTFRQMHMDEQNRISHWIIRNGGKVYQLIADIEVGSRLLPTRSEFIDYFTTTRFDYRTREHVRIPMEPGSQEWLKAEEAADAKRRHYMRIMLVLQGLADRSVSFHPLPAGGVNFLDLAAQDSGKVTIINELDHVLTSGREPFRDWQRRLNNQLRPGVRVIGDFGGYGTAFSRMYDEGDRWRRGGHPRLHPANAPYPPSRVPHLIEGRKDGGLVFRYQRTDMIWDEYGRQVEPKVRASCVVRPSDAFILPFDLATVADLETYLNARTERHAYLSMVPVIRAALAAKREEEAQEAPFRLLLTGAILATHPDVDQAEIESAVPGLVQHYKLANRWARALVIPDPAEQGKAVAAIVREYTARRRATTGTAGKDTRALAAAKTIPGMLAVGRRKSGGYVAYASSAEYQSTWLDEYRINTKGEIFTIQRWTIPQGRSLAALVMLHTDPQWSSWNLRASRAEHISRPEASEFAERYLFPLAPGPAVAITHKSSDENEQAGWFTLICWRTPVGSAAPVDDNRKVEAMLVEVRGRWKRSQSGDIEPVLFEDSWHWIGNERVDVPGGAAQLRDDGRPVHFGYAGGTGDRSLPGIPVEELAFYRQRYGHDWDGRVLVWMDDQQWAEVAHVQAAIDGSIAAIRQERGRREQEAYRYRDPVMALIKAAQEGEAKARFLEDYGADAADLWPKHLESLGLRDPIHQRVIWGIVAIALQHGHPVVGQTLDALADYAWDEHHNHAPGEWHEKGARVDLGDFGRLVVPEPNPVESDSEES